MKLFNKDEFGWNIGYWYTPISVRWFKSKIMRFYGIRFDDKYNTICFGRLEIRIWKPKCMRSGNGIYFYREIPYDRTKVI